MISASVVKGLNNYNQFENSVDFKKEIAHNVISSNELFTSRDMTDISRLKKYSKELVEHEITSSKHSTVASINSNQEQLKEPMRDSKIKTNKTNAPITTIIGDSMKKSFW